MHNATAPHTLATKTTSPFFLSVLLILITLILYGQVLDFDFIDYDDMQYVSENYHIHKGFSRDSLSWAFRTFHAGFWQPMVWLSFMLDIEMFGLNPAGFHATNLTLHIINALLLFLFLRQTTRASWRSWLVALLFAVHPLHIESFAWIAERKDVLSAFFLMLVMISYSRYTKRRSLKSYGLVIVFFILGLASKAMLVSVPFLLLFLDFWPLDRTGSRVSGSGNQVQQNVKVMQLLQEKMPLLLITFVFCVLTLFTQKSGGAVVSQEIHPLSLRLANGVVSYISYIGKMFLPINLAALYPFPPSIPLIKSTAAVIALVLMTAAAVKVYPRKPYIMIGWFWYIISIFPVIGLVQVGPQAMADRFTYIPLIGLFIVCVWGCADMAAGWKVNKIAATIITTGILLSYSFISWNQVQFWDNTYTLFNRAVAVTDNNYVAHAGLGMYLSRQGKLAEAADHLQKALDIAPGYKTAHIGYGIVLAKMQQLPQAEFHFSKALEIDPHFIPAHFNLGLTLYKRLQLVEAAEHFRSVLAAEPLHPKAHFYLGNILAEQENMSAAISHYQKALVIMPNDKRIRENLKRALQVTE